MTRSRRKLIFTVAAAGAIAVIGEHLVKPPLRRKLRI